MSTGTYWVIAVASLLVSAACASRVQVRSDLPEPRCLEGVGYGIDTVAAPDATHRRDKIWLVLGGGPSGEGRGRGAQVILQNNSLRYGGEWRSLGDSIIVLQNSFPSARWVLHEKVGELRGQLQGQGDTYTTDSLGRVVRPRSNWPAAFKAVSCDAVGKPSNTR